MRILWLKSELLHPVDKGGKIRSYEMLRELKKKHQITYLTLDDGTGSEDAMRKAIEYAQETIAIPHTAAEKFSGRFYVELLSNLTSDLPYALQKYKSDGMRQAIKDAVAAARFDIVVCDFLVPAVNLPDDLDIPTLLFQHNVEAVIWRRHFDVAKNPAKKAYLKRQLERMVRYERRACRRFDTVVAVSEKDADTMRSDYQVNNVHAIATGVDTSFFAPGGDLKKDGFNIVFTGSMDWLPNEDGIQWFVSDVLPRIRREIPDVSLTVVGRNPYQSLLELSQSDPAIRVTGRVDDVRPYMEKSSVYVVPIRIGGGTRLKIFEAMAMELAVVSTTVGAEGLPVSHGDNVILTDEPDDFAEAVVRLLRDQTLARELGQNAARKVRERHGWKSVAAEFSDICELTAGRKNRVRRTGQRLEDQVSI